MVTHKSFYSEVGLTELPIVAGVSGIRLFRSVLLFPSFGNLGTGHASSRNI